MYRIVGRYLHVPVPVPAPDRITELGRVESNDDRSPAAHHPSYHQPNGGAHHQPTTTSHPQTRGTISPPTPALRIIPRPTPTPRVAPHALPKHPTGDPFPLPDRLQVIPQCQPKRAVRRQRAVLDELSRSQTRGQGAGHAEPQFGGGRQVWTELGRSDAEVGEFLVDVAAGRFASLVNLE